MLTEDVSWDLEGMTKLFVGVGEARLKELEEFPKG